MRGPLRGVLRFSMKEAIVAAIVAVISFMAGLYLSSSANAQETGEPELEDVSCVTDCDGKAASIGSTVELTGTGLATVEKVKFTSDGEKRAKAEPESTDDELVEVVVPEGAVTGPPRVVDADRNKSTSPVDLEITDSTGSGTGEPTEPQPTEPEPTDPGTGTGTEPGNTSPDGLSVDPTKGFFRGKRMATAHLGGGSATEVEVVSATDGTTVATVPVQPATDGSESTATWDGVTDTGEVAPNGEYEFRAGTAGDSAAFEQYDHIFPVNGKHTYGDGIGAGRGHQGQDVFADCGTKLVAARAGTIEHSDTHSEAGNYVVIDGKKTDADYVYMHMAEPSLLAEGEKAKTGGAIGHVGETGNASGCHLHFEVWPSGWQEGDFDDPEPLLKAWDEYS